MAVPDFQSFFKPLLEIAADGQEHSLREARERIARDMRLSEADIAERLPSGTQAKCDNRVAWAKSYFTQAKVFVGMSLSDVIDRATARRCSPWRRGPTPSTTSSWPSDRARCAS